MFHNILVCVDGSPHAERALTEAIDLAESQRARLTILSSVATPPYWASGPMSAPGIDSLAVEYAAEAEAALRRAADRVPASVPLTKILSPEPIRDALTDQIKTGRHDLLVMGSRGRGALTASLLGSVSHFALNHSRVPVLIVHDEAAHESARREQASDDEHLTVGVS